MVVPRFTTRVLAFYRKKCLSSRPPRMKKSWDAYKIRGAHLQCVNNQCAKFEYKEMKTVGVKDYTNQTPPRHLGWKKCLSSTPVKMWKYLSNVHKIKGAHLQCVNNHYAKFEYKEMKTVWVTDYTNLTPSTHFGWKIMFKFNTLKKWENIYQMCTK